MQSPAVPGFQSWVLPLYGATVNANVLELGIRVCTYMLAASGLVVTLHAVPSHLKHQSPDTLYTHVCWWCRLGPAMKGPFCLNCCVACILLSLGVGYIQAAPTYKFVPKPGSQQAQALVAAKSTDGMLHQAHKHARDLKACMCSIQQRNLNIAVSTS